MHSKLIKMLVASDKNRAPTLIDEDAQNSTQHRSFVEPDELSITEVVNFLEKQIRKGKIVSPTANACNRSHQNEIGLQLLDNAKKRSSSNSILVRRPPSDSLPPCKQEESNNLKETREDGCLRSPGINFEPRRAQENMEYTFNEVTVTMTK